MNKLLIALVSLAAVAGLGRAATASSFPVAAKAGFALGDSRAPVTLVEYASLTCDYCVRFHREVLPLIKSRHIDTGRVRFVYRDFPTSAAATRGAVAARCAGPHRYFTMLDALYSAVGRWSRARDVDAALVEHATSLGLDRAAFRACLDDPRHVRSIDEEQQRATKEHGVLGTPTFLVNGKVVRGMKDIGEIDMLIEQARLRTRQ
jgi:protein-disulfide isomerase